ALHWRRVPLPNVRAIDMRQRPGKDLLHLAKISRRHRLFEQLVHAHLGGQMAGRPHTLELDTNTRIDPSPDHAGELLGDEEGRQLKDQQRDRILIEMLSADDDATAERMPVWR